MHDTTANSYFCRRFYYYPKTNIILAYHSAFNKTIYSKIYYLLFRREKALKACHCGVRKNLKQFQRQTSSSSDNFKATIAELDRRRKKKDTPSQLVVNYVDKGEKTVSVAVSKENIKQVMKDVTTCVCIETLDNNNIATVKTMPSNPIRDNPKLKNLVLEQNGNIIKDPAQKVAVNDNYIPDIAQV